MQKWYWSRLLVVLDYSRILTPKLFFPKTANNRGPTATVFIFKIVRLWRFKNEILMGYTYTLRRILIDILGCFYIPFYKKIRLRRFKKEIGCTVTMIRIIITSDLTLSWF